MRTDPRHHLGALGEQQAVDHLLARGYRIVARNHRTRFGELDVVAMDGDVLVFCEVKTRRGRGQPWDALGPRKQQQVRRMATAYLADVTDRPRGRAIRFDAIGIVYDGYGAMVSLTHLEGAF